MSDNPVKDMLFGILESGRPARLAAEGRFGEVVQAALDAFFEAWPAEPAPDMLDTVATGILHHILTISGTPSRRKAQLGGVDLDIAIPGTRELQNNPGAVLIVQICCDHTRIPGRLRDTQKVQPIHDNIWILTRHKGGPCQYTVCGDATFPDMVENMMAFAKKFGHRRLGIIP